MLGELVVGEGGKIGHGGFLISSDGVRAWGLGRKRRATLKQVPCLPDDQWREYAFEAALE